VWLALVVVYIVWGSTYLAIRVVVTEGLPPLLSMGVRFLLAGPLLALVLATRGGWRRLAVSRRELAGSAVVGVLLLLGGNGMVAVSEQHVPSGLAALLVATTPLWLVGFRALTGDRPGLATWLGTAVGFAGVAVLARPGGHGDAIPLASTLLVVLATFLWATGSFASGRITMPRDPFVSAVWQMTLAGVALILSGLATGEAPRMREALVGGVPTQGALALAYLIAFGSLAGYTAYYWLLRNAPISMVATYAYVNPIVAVLLGWALLSEPVTSTVLIGGGLAVLGVLLVVSTERHGHRREEPADAPGEPAAGTASAPSPSSVPSSRAPVDGSPARPAEVQRTGR
jgi:drug/metabolite transporter (DMT)-like permease